MLESGKPTRSPLPIPLGDCEATANGPANLKEGQKQLSKQS